MRLPEQFYAEVARKTGQSLDGSAKKRVAWKGRRVLTYDGSTVSMHYLGEQEHWTHILAYNLIRTIIAQAATKHHIEPRTI